MIRHRIFWIALVAPGCFGLISCQLTGLPPSPAQTDFAVEIRRQEPPSGQAGICWATDKTAAIIETVTETVTEADPTTGDAALQTQTRQQIVQPREQIWFRTPCDAELTPDVIATLQRALAVRGIYAAVPTGALDPATRMSIRAFQAPRGLNSDRLSLAAARELGVVASDLGAGASG